MFSRDDVADLILNFCACKNPMPHTQKKVEKI